jgi:hypothetical protein
MKLDGPNHYLDVVAARKIIDALLTASDYPDVLEAERLAKAWLADTKPSEDQGMTELGAFLMRGAGE